nr:response regulator transcription factor [Paraburkholderia kururiensis]
MRILIAEDDSILADGLVRSLRQSAYAVDHVKNGVEADTALSMQSFDLLILDLGLPRMPGLEVLRRLRARNSNLPVLILTAADSVDERVKGLDLGADDYMAKPFALNELEARVRALTRRGAGGGPTVVRHGALSFDQVGRIACINDQVLDLSARELGVLEVLLQRIGRLVSKEQLVDHLCEWGEEVSNNAIEVYVHRLRKKLEPGGVRIATVRGLGYCLEKAAQAPVPASATSAAAALGAPAANDPSASSKPVAGSAASVEAGETSAASGLAASATSAAPSPASAATGSSAAVTPTSKPAMPATHPYK